MSTRVAWVTGAGSGIGRAVASRLLRDGWTVAASSRSMARLQSLKKQSDRCCIVPCDVRKERSVRRAFARVRKLTGRIDLLVNAAGVTVFKDLLRTSDKEFLDIIGTNLTGTFLVTRAVVPSMMRRRSGMILTVLSYAAKTTYTGSAAYSASKSGAEALLRVLREEVRSHNVRVVNVFPGAVDTPMWSASVRRRLGRRMMSADDVATAVAALVALPRNSIPEELILRPPIGDLTV